MIGDGRAGRLQSEAPKLIKVYLANAVVSFNLTVVNEQLENTTGRKCNPHNLVMKGTAQRFFFFNMKKKCSGQKKSKE